MLSSKYTIKRWLPVNLKERINVFLKALEFRRTVGFVIPQHFRVQGDCQFYAIVSFSDGLIIFLTYRFHNTFPRIPADKSIQYYEGYLNSYRRLYCKRDSGSMGNGMFPRKLPLQFLISVYSAFRLFHTDGCRRSKMTMSRLDNFAWGTVVERAFVFSASKVRCLALKLAAVT